MKLQKKHPHEKDELVKLHDDYETTHLYVIRGENHDDLGFTSVTTYLKQLSPQFDALKQIKKWRENNDPRIDGRTDEQILKDWEDNRNEAARLGTYMHEQFELYFNDEKYDDSIPEFKLFLDWIKIYKIKPYRTEMTIFSDKYKLVGNVDLITDNGDGTFDIWDYKRTFGISDANYGKMFYEPISELKCSDRQKYALQLSLYRYIYESEYGFKINKIWNVAMKGDSTLVVEQKYLFEEVIRILNNRL